MSDSIIFKELSELEIATAKIKGIIAGTIANKRLELGMSQKQFADFMEVTQGMVSRWESCDYNFTIESAITIFDKLGIKFSVNIDDTRVSNSAYLKLRKNVEYLQLANNTWQDQNSNVLKGA